MLPVEYFPLIVHTSSMFAFFANYYCLEAIEHEHIDYLVSRDVYFFNEFSLLSVDFGN